MPSFRIYYYDNQLFLARRRNLSPWAREYIRTPITRKQLEKRAEKGRQCGCKTDSCVPCLAQAFLERGRVSFVSVFDW